MDLKNLQQKIGIKFRDTLVLKTALIHRSYLNEHPDEKLSSNERLEFLGDAVLELIISQKIFQDYPDLPEGNLTALRSRIVCTKTLSQVAQVLGLGDDILLSKGEEEGGGRLNSTLLANCVEAIIGAIFLDQGTTQAKKFVAKFFFNRIPVFSASGLKDAKSLLQEKTQEKEKITPIYKILTEHGPDHAKIFSIGVFLDTKMLAEGEGRSKQEAEESAAQAALEKYR